MPQGKWRGLGRALGGLSEGLTGIAGWMYELEKEKKVEARRREDVTFREEGRRLSIEAANRGAMANYIEGVQTDIQRGDQDYASSMLGLDSMMESYGIAKSDPMYSAAKDLFFNARHTYERNAQTDMARRYQDRMAQLPASVGASEAMDEVLQAYMDMWKSEHESTNWETLPGDWATVEDIYGGRPTVNVPGMTPANEFISRAPAVDPKDPEAFRASVMEWGEKLEPATRYEPDWLPGPPASTLEGRRVTPEQENRLTIAGHGGVRYDHLRQRFMAEQIREGIAAGWTEDQVKRQMELNRSRLGQQADEIRKELLGEYEFIWNANETSVIIVPKTIYDLWSEVLGPEQLEEALSYGLTSSFAQANASMALEIINGNVHPNDRGKMRAAITDLLSKQRVGGVSAVDLATANLKRITGELTQDDLEYIRAAKVPEYMDNAVKSVVEFIRESVVSLLGQDITGKTPEETESIIAQIDKIRETLGLHQYENAQINAAVMLTAALGGNFANDVLLLTQMGLPQVEATFVARDIADRSFHAIQDREIRAIMEELDKGVYEGRVEGVGGIRLLHEGEYHPGGGFHPEGDESVRRAEELEAQAEMFLTQRLDLEAAETQDTEFAVSVQTESRLATSLPFRLQTIRRQWTTGQDSRGRGQFASMVPQEEGYVLIAEHVEDVITPVPGVPPGGTAASALVQRPGGVAAQGLVTEETARFNYVPYDIMTGERMSYEDLRARIRRFVQYRHDFIYSTPETRGTTNQVQIENQVKQYIIEQRQKAATSGEDRAVHPEAAGLWATLPFGYKPGEPKGREEGIWEPEATPVTQRELYIARQRLEATTSVEPGLAAARERDWMMLDSPTYPPGHSQQGQPNPFYGVWQLYYGGARPILQDNYKLERYRQR